MIACFNGHFEIANLLITEGADINIQNSTGFTSLTFACEKGHFEISELLIYNDADVYVKNHHGKMASDYLNSNLRRKLEECLKYNKKYYMSKAKDRSNLLREELVSKYWSPENIKKWSLAFNKDFDEVFEIM